jgi:hypothetical protein
MNYASLRIKKRGAQTRYKGLQNISGHKEGQYNYKALTVQYLASHIDRAVCDMKYLRPLENWDRVFESLSRHECLFVYFLCSC